MGAFSRYVVIPLILVCVGIVIGQRFLRPERSQPSPIEAAAAAPPPIASTTQPEEPPLIQASGQFQNNLYPSLILSLGTADPDYARFLEVRLSQMPRSGALQLRVESPLLREPLIVALSPGSTTAELNPILPWNYEALRRVSQDQPQAFVVSVVEAERTLAQATVACVIHAVNQVVSRVISPATGGWQDTSICFAGIVNEDHPAIDTLLRDAIRRGAMPSFTGYQGDARVLLAQLDAIWEVLSQRGLHYVDLSITSSVTPGIATQSVRFVDQSLRDQGANCVDASVLFASILKRIGLRPVLVFKPGHCFVAVYDSAEGGELIGIETTLLGYAPFRAALASGATELQQTLPYLGSPGYSTVDICVARQQGVSAIGSLDP